MTTSNNQNGSSPGVTILTGPRRPWEPSEDSLEKIDFTLEEFRRCNPSEKDQILEYLESRTDEVGRKLVEEAQADATDEEGRTLAAESRLVLEAEYRELLAEESRELANDESWLLEAEKGRIKTEEGRLVAEKGRSERMTAMERWAKEEKTKKKFLRNLKAKIYQEQLVPSSDFWLDPLDEYFYENARLEDHSSY